VTAELSLVPYDGSCAALVIDPALRRTGLGKGLALRLVAVARALGLANVFLRIHTNNDVGIGCYASVGFAPVSAEEQMAFNVGQPAAYLWTRHQS